MAKSISNSVGKGGANQAADVQVVRDLLAAWAKNAGLVAFGSGAMDQPTIAAITRFQTDELHRAAPDGRVDPGGGTMAALLKLADAAMADLALAANVTYGPGVAADAHLASDYSIAVIKKALGMAGMNAAVITSTLRGPQEQAAAMYKNAAKNLAGQFALYGPAGDEVLKVYQKHHAESAAVVTALMSKKIQELLAAGRHVSNHVVTHASYAARNVIDIGLHSTEVAAGASFKLGELTKAFIKLQAAGYIAKFIDETGGTNSCWHLEIVPGAKPM